MIEAAIQQGDLGAGGYEAWVFLGETRSMDEREEAAIRALKEGVRRAEEAGANGEGMLVNFHFRLVVFEDAKCTQRSLWQYHTPTSRTPKLLTIFC